MNKGVIIYQKIGWVLFLLCSIAYILSSIKSGDALSIIGGFLFFFGCIAFIIPMFWKTKSID